MTMRTTIVGVQWSHEQNITVYAPQIEGAILGHELLGIGYFCERKNGFGPHEFFEILAGTKVGRGILHKRRRYQLCYLQAKTDSFEKGKH